MHGTGKTKVQSGKITVLLASIQCHCLNLVASSKGGTANSVMHTVPVLVRQVGRARRWQNEGSIW